MARISAVCEPDLFTITVEGDLTYEEIVATIRFYYSPALPADMLWDLSRGSLNTITVEHFRAVAALAKTVVQHRDGGRTAYVGGHDVVFSLMCMYTALAALADVPIEYSVFKTVFEARQWFAEQREADKAEAADTRPPWIRTSPRVKV